MRTCMQLHAGTKTGSLPSCLPGNMTIVSFLRDSVVLTLEVDPVIGQMLLPAQPTTGIGLAASKKYRHHLSSYVSN
jgi:hypothetical protein